MSHTSVNSGVFITNDTLCRLFSLAILINGTKLPIGVGGLCTAIAPLMYFSTSNRSLFTRTILLVLPLSAIPIPTHLAHSPNSILLARRNMIDQLKPQTFPRPWPPDQRLFAAVPHPNTGSSLPHVRLFLGCYRRAPHAPHPFSTA